MGPAGTLVIHLGCAAIELAIRVASRYVTSRDVGPGLVAGSGLEETFTLGFYHWRGGTLNTGDSVQTGSFLSPRWVLQVECPLGLKIHPLRAFRQTEHLSNLS